MKVQIVTDSGKVTDIIETGIGEALYLISREQDRHAATQSLLSLAMINVLNNEGMSDMEALLTMKGSVETMIKVTQMQEEEKREKDSQPSTETLKEVIDHILADLMH